MMIKDALERMHGQLGEFEDALRGLKNQNLADIVGSAKGKIAQAMQHADAEHDISTIAPKSPELPFDPSNAGA